MKKKGAMTMRIEIEIESKNRFETKLAKSILKECFNTCVKL